MIRVDDFKCIWYIVFNLTENKKKLIIICVIQYFEPDYLSKVSLKIRQPQNLENFHPCLLDMGFRSFKLC